MKTNRVQDIKRAQKESLLFQKLSEFFLRIKQDEPSLQTLTLNRVRLSKDKSMCNVYFIANGGIKAFEEMLKTLVLYKPSMRSSLAKSTHARYTPQIKFRYDEHAAEQERVSALIDRLKDEGNL